MLNSCKEEEGILVTWRVFFVYLSAKRPGCISSEENALCWTLLTCQINFRKFQWDFEKLWCHGFTAGSKESSEYAFVAVEMHPLEVDGHFCHTWDDSNSSQPHHSPYKARSWRWLSSHRDQSKEINMLVFPSLVPRGPGCSTRAGVIHSTVSGQPKGKLLANFSFWCQNV